MGGKAVSIQIQIEVSLKGPRERGYTKDSKRIPVHRKKVERKK